MDIKVSVVVPVYNVEKYLKECLDSLINQTLNDIEIICVNDGSTDSSLDILEEYASSDSRIKIISQENKGLSGARNTGMKYIKGKYTFFIDSDDWIELNALENLYDEAERLNLDMLFYQVINYHENTSTFEKTEYSSIKALDSQFEGKIFTYKDVKDILFKIAHSAFNKLYKTEFLESIDAEFPEGLNYEDVYFFFKVFLNASRTSILRKPFYYYRIREGSIMSHSYEKSLDIFEILEKTGEIITKTDILDTNISDFILYLIVNFKNVYQTVDSQFKDTYFTYLKNSYDKFNLDKASDFSKWHYTDKAFFDAINPSDNSKEFDLTREMLEYKFLSNHYKGLYELSQNNNSKTFKEKLKEILKS